MLALLLALLPVEAHDPPLDDRLRFPPAAAALQCLASNQAYRDHLEFRLATELHHEAWLTQALAETDALRDAWGHLAAAQNEWFPDCYRRQHLAALRDRIGTARYEAGVMPPCLPLWRCHEIKVP